MLVLFSLHTSPCSDICSLSLHRLPHRHVRLWCHLAGGIFGIVSSLWAGLEFLKAWSWCFFVLFFMAFSCRGGALLRDHTGTHPRLRGGRGLGEFREASWAGPAEPRGPRATWGSYLLYSASRGVHWSWSLQKTSAGSLNPHVVWLAGSPAGNFVLWLGYHLLCGLSAQARGFNSGSASWCCVTFSRFLTISVPLVCKLGRTVGSAGLSRAFLQGAPWDAS